MVIFDFPSHPHIKLSVAYFDISYSLTFYEQQFIFLYNDILAGFLHVRVLCLKSVKWHLRFHFVRNAFHIFLKVNLIVFFFIVGCGYINSWGTCATNWHCKHRVAAIFTSGRSVILNFLLLVKFCLGCNRRTQWMGNEFVQKIVLRDKSGLRVTVKNGKNLRKLRTNQSHHWYGSGYIGDPVTYCILVSVWSLMGGWNPNNLVVG